MSRRFLDALGVAGVLAALILFLHQTAAGQAPASKPTTLGDVANQRRPECSCFIPGTMGLNPTGADPHSGISITPGGMPGQGEAPAQGGFLPQPFPGSTNTSQPPKAAPKKQ